MTDENRSTQNSTTNRKAGTVPRIIVGAVILSLLLFGWAAWTLMQSVNNGGNPTQRTSNETNGTTNPQSNSGNPAERTTPSPSGGEGNTLLKPPAQ